MRWAHFYFMHHFFKSTSYIGFKAECFSTIPLKDNHYTTLGIGRNATKAEIKAAYYGKCKLLHPDVMYGAAASKKAVSESQLEQDDSTITHKFRLVAEAYECLSDSDARQIYDASLIVAQHKDTQIQYENENPYQKSVRNVRNRYNTAYHKELRNKKTPPDINATFDRNIFEETTRVAKNRASQQSYPSMWWLARNESRLSSAQKTADFSNPTRSQNDYSFFYKSPQEAYNHRDYFEELHRTRDSPGSDYPEENPIYKAYDSPDSHTKRHRTRLKLVGKYTLITLVYGLFLSFLTIAMFKEHLKEKNNSREKLKPVKEKHP